MNILNFVGLRIMFIIGILIISNAKSVELIIPKEVFVLSVEKIYMKQINKLNNQLAVLEELLVDYKGKTIDNIIQQLKARIDNSPKVVDSNPILEILKEMI